MKQNELTQEMVASKLLFPLWMGIDPNYKERYRSEVWQHFENNIRVAAYTSKLNIFLAKFMRLMSVEILAKHMSAVNSIMNSGQDKVILRWLRDETTYLVLQVRMMRQEINDSYKEIEQ